MRRLKLKKRMKGQNVPHDVNETEHDEDKDRHNQNDKKDDENDEGDNRNNYGDQQDDPSAKVTAQSPQSNIIYTKGKTDQKRTNDLDDDKGSGENLRGEDGFREVKGGDEDDEGDDGAMDIGGFLSDVRRGRKPRRERVRVYIRMGMVS